VAPNLYTLIQQTLSISYIRTFMTCERAGLDWGWLRCYGGRSLLNTVKNYGRWSGPGNSLAVSRMSHWPT